MRPINNHNWPLVISMIFIIALAAPINVNAHEGEAGIELSVNQLPPGGTLQIEGFNLGADLTVNIILEKDARRFPLGQALADDHGDFSSEFALPQDLPVGLYTVTAIDQSVPGSEVFLATATLRVEMPKTSTWLNTAAPLFGIGVLFIFAGWVYLRSRRKKT